MKIKAFFPVLVLFSAFSILEMIGEQLFHTDGSTLLLFTTKPVLMPLLIVYLWVNTKFSKPFHKLIAVGLVLGWIGDVLLMFNNNDLFVFGLAAFLLCHICYICAFVNNIRNSGYKLSSINKLVLALLPLFLLVVLYTYLFPFIAYNEVNKPFLIPVTVYSVTIITMCLFALWRIGSTSRLSAAVIILGACTFVISDSLIALNKFTHPFKYANVFIMFTYCFAQFMITTGAIQHQKKQAN